MPKKEYRRRRGAQGRKRQKAGSPDCKEPRLDDDAGQSGKQLKEKLTDLYSAVLDEPIPEHLAEFMRKHRKDKDPQ